MDNKFLSFIKPALDYVDSGEFFKAPFKWLYVLIGVSNLLAPFSLLYIANRVFDAPAKFVIAFLLVWLVLVANGWVCFQIWWNRKDAVLASSKAGDDFAAIPVFAHFLQTAGEALGTSLAIAGTGITLIAMVILGDENFWISRMIGVNVLSFGLAGVLINPILGFLIIVLSRFIAEQSRALAAIANNTKKP
jgi:hypothetical protein